MMTGILNSYGFRPVFQDQIGYMSMMMAHENMSVFLNNKFKWYN